MLTRNGRTGLIGCRWWKPSVIDDIKSQAAEDVLKGMQQAWEDARQLLLTRRERMKKNADKGRRDEKYEVGDRVLMSTGYSINPSI